MSNPLKDDLQLKTQLKDFDNTVDSIESFRIWRQSFLKQFQTYLSDDGSNNAQRSYIKLYELDTLLIQKLGTIQKYIVNGELTSTRSTVKARMCLSDVASVVSIVTIALEELLPKSRSEETKVGYTKFHMGAVLVRDGFHEYGQLETIIDTIEGLCLYLEETEKVDTSVIDTMRRLETRINAFCDVMADLGLFQAMIKVRTLLEATNSSKLPKNDTDIDINSDDCINDEDIDDILDMCNDMDPKVEDDVMVSERKQDVAERRRKEDVDGSDNTGIADDVTSTIPGIAERDPAGYSIVFGQKEHIGKSSVDDSTGIDAPPEIAERDPAGYSIVFGQKEDSGKSSVDDSTGVDVAPEIAERDPAGYSMVFGQKDNFGKSSLDDGTGIDAAPEIAERDPAGYSIVFGQKEDVGKSSVDDGTGVDAAPEISERDPAGYSMVFGQKETIGKSSVDEGTGVDAAQEISERDPAGYSMVFGQKEAIGKSSVDVGTGVDAALEIAERDPAGYSMIFGQKENAGKSSVDDGTGVDAAPEISERDPAGYSIVFGQKEAIGKSSVDEGTGVDAAPEIAERDPAGYSMLFGQKEAIGKSSVEDAIGVDATPEITERDPAGYSIVFGQKENVGKSSVDDGTGIDATPEISERDPAGYSFVFGQKEHTGNSSVVDSTGVDSPPEIAERDPAGYSMVFGQKENVGTSATGSGTGDDIIPEIVERIPAEYSMAVGLKEDVKQQQPTGPQQRRRQREQQAAELKDVFKSLTEKLQVEKNIDLSELKQQRHATRTNNPDPIIEQYVASNPELFLNFGAAESNDFNKTRPEHSDDEAFKSVTNLHQRESQPYSMANNESKPDNSERESPNNDNFETKSHQRESQPYAYANDSATTKSDIRMPKDDKKTASALPSTENKKHKEPAADKNSDASTMQPKRTNDNSDFDRGTKLYQRESQPYSVVKNKLQTTDEANAVERETPEENEFSFETKPHQRESQPYAYTNNLGATNGEGDTQMAMAKDEGMFASTVPQTNYANDDDQPDAKKKTLNDNEMSESSTNGEATKKGILGKLFNKKKKRTDEPQVTPDSQSKKENSDDNDIDRGTNLHQRESQPYSIANSKTPTSEEAKENSKDDNFDAVAKSHNRESQPYSYTSDSDAAKSKNQMSMEDAKITGAVSPSTNSINNDNEDFDDNKVQELPHDGETTKKGILGKLFNKWKKKSNSDEIEETPVTSDSHEIQAEPFDDKDVDSVTNLHQREAQPYSMAKNEAPMSKEANDYLKGNPDDAEAKSHQRESQPYAYPNDSGFTESEKQMSKYDEKNSSVLSSTPNSNKNEYTAGKNEASKRSEKQESSHDAESGKKGILGKLFNKKKPLVTSDSNKAQREPSYENEVNHITNLHQRDSQPYSMTNRLAPTSEEAKNVENETPDGNSLDFETSSRQRESQPYAYTNNSGTTKIEKQLSTDEGVKESTVSSTNSASNNEPPNAENEFAANNDVPEASTNGETTKKSILGNLFIKKSKTVEYLHQTPDSQNKKTERSDDNDIDHGTNLRQRESQPYSIAIQKAPNSAKAADVESSNDETFDVVTESHQRDSQPYAYASEPGATKTDKPISNDLEKVTSPLKTTITSNDSKRATDENEDINNKDIPELSNVGQTKKKGMLGKLFNKRKMKAEVGEIDASLANSDSKKMQREHSDDNNDEVNLHQRESQIYSMTNAKENTSESPNDKNLLELETTPQERESQPYAYTNDSSAIASDNQILKIEEMGSTLKSKMNDENFTADNNEATFSREVHESFHDGETTKKRSLGKIFNKWKKKSGGDEIAEPLASSDPSKLQAAHSYDTDTDHAAKLHQRESQPYSMASNKAPSSEQVKPHEDSPNVDCLPNRVIVENKDFNDARKLRRIESQSDDHKTLPSKHTEASYNGKVTESGDNVDVNKKGLFGKMFNRKKKNAERDDSDPNKDTIASTSDTNVTMEAFLPDSATQPANSQVRELQPYSMKNNPDVSPTPKDYSFRHPALATYVKSDGKSSELEVIKDESNLDVTVNTHQRQSQPYEYVKYPVNENYAHVLAPKNSSTPETQKGESGFDFIVNSQQRESQPYEFVNNSIMDGDIPILPVAGENSFNTDPQRMDYDFDINSHQRESQPYEYVSDPCTAGNIPILPLASENFSNPDTETDESNIDFNVISQQRVSQPYEFISDPDTAGNIPILPLVSERLSTPDVQKEEFDSDFVVKSHQRDSQPYEYVNNPNTVGNIPILPLAAEKALHPDAQKGESDFDFTVKSQQREPQPYEYVNDPNSSGSNLDVMVKSNSDTINSNSDTITTATASKPPKDKTVTGTQSLYAAPRSKKNKGKSKQNSPSTTLNSSVQNTAAEENLLYAAPRRKKISKRKGKNSSLRTTGSTENDEDSNLETSPLQVGDNEIVNVSLRETEPQTPVNIGWEKPEWVSATLRKVKDNPHKDTTISLDQDEDGKEESRLYGSEISSEVGGEQTTNSGNEVPSSPVRSALKFADGPNTEKGYKIVQPEQFDAVLSPLKNTIHLKPVNVVEEDESDPTIFNVTLKDIEPEGPKEFGWEKPEWVSPKLRKVSDVPHQVANNLSHEVDDGKQESRLLVSESIAGADGESTANSCSEVIISPVRSALSKAGDVSEAETKCNVGKLAQPEANLSPHRNTLYLKPSNVGEETAIDNFNFNYTEPEGQQVIAWKNPERNAEKLRNDVPRKDVNNLLDQCNDGIDVPRLHDSEKSSDSGDKAATKSSSDIPLNPVGGTVLNAETLAETESKHNVVLPDQQGGAMSPIKRAGFRKPLNVGLAEDSNQAMANIALKEIEPEQPKEIGWEKPLWVSATLRKVKEVPHKATTNDQGKTNISESKSETNSAANDELSKKPGIKVHLRPVLSPVKMVLKPKAANLEKDSDGMLASKLMSHSVLDSETSNDKQKVPSTTNPGIQVTLTDVATSAKTLIKPKVLNVNGQSSPTLENKPLWTSAKLRKTDRGEKLKIQTIEAKEDSSDTNAIVDKDLIKGNKTTNRVELAKMKFEKHVK